PAVVGVHLQRRHDARPDRRPGLQAQSGRPSDAGAQRPETAGPQIFQIRCPAGRTAMLYRTSIHAMALAAALLMTIRDGAAFDEALYPDWGGGWMRLGSGNFDPSQPRGLAQQAPLTPEYRAVFEASVADQDGGGQGSNPGYRCSPHGMPRIMIAIHH